METVTIGRIGTRGRRTTQLAEADHSGPPPSPAPIALVRQWPIAPGKFGRIQAATCGVFPFCFRGQSQPGPVTKSCRINPVDGDNGVIFTARTCKISPEWPFGGPPLTY